MLADIIQNPLYITATCVLYTKHYITNCCTGYLITGTTGPGKVNNEGIPLCSHSDFEMLHECFSNLIPCALVCNDHSLKLMLLLVLSDSWKVALKTEVMRSALKEELVSQGCRTPSWTQPLLKKERGEVDDLLGAVSKLSLSIGKKYCRSLLYN